VAMHACRIYRNRLWGRVARRALTLLSLIGFDQRAIPGAALEWTLPAARRVFFGRPDNQFDSSLMKGDLHVKNT
jgi:hypothetical protein